MLIRDQLPLLSGTPFADLVAKLDVHARVSNGGDQPEPRRRSDPYRTIAAL